MSRIRAVVLLACMSLLAACNADSTTTSGSPTTSVADTTSTSSQTSTTAPNNPVFQLPDAGEDVAHVEMVAAGDDRLILAYTTPDTEGRRLWVSVIEYGRAAEPVEVASNMTDVPLDEFRPSISVGPEGGIAIAWTSFDNDVYVALSEDGGETFDKPTRMNQERRGMQILPVVTYEGASLLAVWIDPRDAPDGAEEPADLYMWSLSGDMMSEVNLTEAQAPSVCGCCRPHLAVENGALKITFRNTTDDGYRDPHQVNLAGEVSAIAPPTWQIEACPIAGPVAVADRVVWFDGSAGMARVLASNGPDTAPDVLLESTEDFRVAAAPRLVTGGDPLVLIPGSPTSQMIDPDGWGLVDILLPSWATAAAFSGDRLIVVGVDEGSLVYEAHEAP